MSGSDAFMNDFQSAVLAYINAEIDDEAWIYFRKLAREGLQEEPVEGSERWTREQLVSEAVTIDQASLGDLLSAFKRRTIAKIASVQDRPVHFIAEEGIFAWALTDDEEDMLSLWLTYPSYPPGW